MVANFRSNPKFIILIRGKLTLLGFIFASLVLSFIYRKTGSNILFVKDSDFLAVFPNSKFSQFFQNGQHLFNNSLAQAWSSGDSWYYGPLYQFLTIPLYLFRSIYDVTTFLFFFLLLTYTMTLFQFYKLNFKMRIQKFHIFALTLLLVVNYPFMAAFQQRNLELIELFYISSAMIAYQKRFYWSAGILIGLASGIKFLPAVIVLHFLTAKNWRAVLGFFCAIIPQLLIAELFLGWRNNSTLKMLLSGEKATLPLRQGLNDVLIRLSGGSATGFTSLLYWTTTITVLALGVIGLRRYVESQTEKNSQWRVWSLLLGFVCILSPHSNSYYFILFTPLVIQIYLSLTVQASKLDFSLLSVALFLISCPLPFAVIWRIVPSDSIAYWKSMLTSLQSFSPIFFGSLVLLF